MTRNLFKKKEVNEKVFIIPFHVTPLKNSIMPENLEGAYVSCYTKGATYEEATKSSLQKLAQDGLHPKEILQPIHEMPVSSWSQHIQEQWPSHINSLPSQNEFEERIASIWKSLLDIT